MLTDDEARHLLHLAADTVDVDPADRLEPTPRRPAWPLLVAAAAVIAVVVALSVVLGTRDADPPPVVATVDPPVAVSVLPSVLGYTAGEARALLESRGLRVATRIVPDCQAAGRPVGTRPEVGAPVDEGDRVRLDLADGAPRAFCTLDVAVNEDARGFLRFARGIGPAPAFADHVTLYAAGADPVRLSVAEAADPSSWGLCGSAGRCTSALTALIDSTEQPVREGSSYVRTYLATTMQVPRTSFCFRADPPAAVRGRNALTLSVSYPTRVDNQSGAMRVCTVDTEVDLYRTDGRIDAVVLRTIGGVRAPAAAPDPASAEPTAEQAALGDRFLTFARGGPPPAFADKVDLYLGNQLMTSISGVDADDPRSWEIGCTTYAGRDCPVSALRAAEDGPAGTSYTVSRGGDSCYASLGALPAELLAQDALSQSVSVGVPEPRACSANWEVQLWYDDDGAITSVNLLLGVA